jgi:hypothetical protein
MLLRSIELENGVDEAAAIKSTIAKQQGQTPKQLPKNQNSQ